MKSGTVTPGVQGEISGTFYDGSGSNVALDGNDFTASSPCFRMGTSEGNTISIGSACIGQFDCNINKDSLYSKISKITWKGAYLRLYVTCGSKFDMGTFYVDKRTESSGMITLTCYDAMQLFDEHKLSEDNISWPVYSNTLIQTICNNRGVSYSTSGLTNYQLQEPDNLDNITERAAISYIAQMSGKYAIIRNNQLVFDWYNTNKSGGYDCGTVFSHEMQCDDVTISGVKITSYDGELTAHYEDSDEYVVTITDNPFITQDNVESVGNNILNNVHNVKFRPGNFTIACNPAIEAGDALLIDTSDDNGIFTLATSVTYKTTSVTEQITADARDETEDARMSADDYIKQYGGGGGGCNHPDAEEVYW